MKRPSAGGKGNPWRCFARWGVGTFLLSAAHTAGLYGPWGVAAVAAAGGRVQGAWALLGAVAGALVFFNFQTGLRFAASAVLRTSSTIRSSAPVSTAAEGFAAAKAAALNALRFVFTLVILAISVHPFSV